MGVSANAGAGCQPADPSAGPAAEPSPVKESGNREGGNGEGDRAGLEPAQVSGDRGGMSEGHRIVDSTTAIDPRTATDATTSQRKETAGSIGARPVPTNRLVPAILPAVLHMDVWTPKQRREIHELMSVPDVGVSRRVFHLSHHRAAIDSIAPRVGASVPHETATGTASRKPVDRHDLYQPVAGGCRSRYPS